MWGGSLPAAAGTRWQRGTEKPRILDVGCRQVPRRDAIQQASNLQVPRSSRGGRVCNTAESLSLAAPLPATTGRFRAGEGGSGADLSASPWRWLVSWQRIRTIKPAFFDNEELAALPSLTRLFFIGLWTVADREGRLEDRPLRLRAQILPYDEADADAMLTQLDRAGFIQRYTVDGNHY